MTPLSQRTDAGTARVRVLSPPLRPWRPVVALVLIATVSLRGAPGPNLVPNGDFEKGRNGAPARWTAPDNLTSFWEKSNHDGKCIRMDTDVYRSEWQKNRDEPGSVKTKTKTRGKKYNTVAGSVGVAVYSHPITVKEDAWYLVEYDIQGRAGEPFVYLKGYVKADEEIVKRSGTKIFFRPEPDGPAFSLVAKGGVGEEKRPPKPGDYIQRFRRRFVTRFPKAGKGGWNRCRGVVHLKKRFHLDVVLLELYAFWPPGEYRFDNVSMRRLSDDEAEAFQAGIRSGEIPSVVPLDD